MNKTIIILVLIIAGLVFYIAKRPEQKVEYECEIDTVQMEPDTVYKEADIIYQEVFVRDTIYLHDTIVVRDTVIFDTVAHTDTTFHDGAKVGVDYSYYFKAFDISYKPPPREVVKITRKPKWWERFGVGVGVGTDFQFVRLELQAGYYFTIHDIIK